MVIFILIHLNFLVFFYDKFNSPVFQAIVFIVMKMIAFGYFILCQLQQLFSQGLQSFLVGLYYKNSVMKTRGYLKFITPITSESICSSIIRFSIVSLIGFLFDLFISTKLSKATEILKTLKREFEKKSYICNMPKTRWGIYHETTG